MPGELAAAVSALVKQELWARERLAALSVLDAGLCRRRLATLDGFVHKELARIEETLREEVYLPFHEINELQADSGPVLRLI